MKTSLGGRGILDIISEEENHGYGFTDNINYEDMTGSTVDVLKTEEKAR